MFPNLRPTESIEPVAALETPVVDETTGVTEVEGVPEAPAPEASRRRRLSLPALRKPAPRRPALKRGSNGRSSSAVTGLHLEQSEAIAVIARPEGGQPVVL